MDSQEYEYTAVPEDDRFSVQSPDGRTVLKCADRHSAEHYAVLLSAAFRLGYKAGYRDARSEAE
jgi:hypothetical protein